MCSKALQTIFLKSLLISNYPVIVIRLGFRDSFMDGRDGGMWLCIVIKPIHSVTVREYSFEV